jgi:hypothetical protein
MLRKMWVMDSFLRGVGGIKHLYNDLSPAQREIRAIAYLMDKWSILLSGKVW